MSNNNQQNIGNEHIFNKIESRLTYAFGGLIFILMFIVYLLNSYMDEKRFEFERNSLVSTIASTLALSIEKVSFGGKYQSSQFIESIIKSDNKLVFAYIIDDEKNIIASSHNSGQNIDHKEFLEQIYKTSYAVEHIIADADIFELDKNIIVVQKNINAGYKGEIKSILLIGIKVQETQFLQGMSTIYSSIAIIILTVLSLFVIRIMSIKIGYPIKSLAWKFYNILKYSPVLIHIHDKDGNITECSASFDEYLGKGRRNIYDAIPKDMVEEHKKINNLVFEKEKSLFINSKFDFDGKEKFYFVNKFPIEKDSDSVVLICGFSIDITKQKELEENLKAKTVELEEINKTLQQRIDQEIIKARERDEIIYEQNKKNAMGELLVNIAHQWRQPLNMVGLYLQNIIDMIEYGDMDKDKIYSTADEVMAQLEYLSKTITKFTDFYEGNRASNVVYLKNALKNAIEFIEQSLNTSNVTIERDITPEDIFIDGEQSSVSEIFLALLINIKEIVDDRKLDGAKIKINIYEIDGDVAIDVLDNCGGIDEKILPIIFDPYTTSHFKSRGKGLGLYNIKNSIERRFKGSISVQNRDNGALFKIRLKRNYSEIPKIFADDDFDDV